MCLSVLLSLSMLLVCLQLLRLVLLLTRMFADVVMGCVADAAVGGLLFTMFVVAIVLCCR